MNFYGDYSELGGFLEEVDSGVAPPLVATTMTTINAGANQILTFTVRDEDGNPVPTAEIASFEVKLMHERHCDCDDPEVVLGTWTFTAPDVFSDGMTSTGDGVFKIELQSSQTSVPGIISAKFTTAFIDPDYFYTGSEVSVTCAEDVLEIILCGAEAEAAALVCDLIADDNGDGIMDDNGDLLVDDCVAVSALSSEINVADDNGDLIADDNGDLLVA